MGLSRTAKDRRTYFVYRLRCPLDGRIRYIGMSSNIRTRFQSHRNDPFCNRYGKGEWILRLREAGRPPLLEVVSPPLTYHQAKAWEIRLTFLFTTLYPNQLVGAPVHLRRHVVEHYVLSPTYGGPEIQERIKQRRKNRRAKIFSD